MPKLLLKIAKPSLLQMLTSCLKFLDVGETMVLFNLPRPWILLSGCNRHPNGNSNFNIKFHTEFCACSLTVGSFQLEEIMVKCSPEVQEEVDGKFKMHFAVNKLFLITCRLNGM